jgi:hypothetical protein
MFSTNIYNFYKSLIPPSGLPTGVEVLYPQQQEHVMKLVKQFTDKYYSDENPRTLIFGINPGRFGAGVTGVNFTAARQLTQQCGIENNLKQQSELSAEFIYEMIDAYGGSERFYSRFFITSVSPLGFIKHGKNVNYYDDKKLQEAVVPFILECINEQYTWNINRRICICLGGEKNYKFLSALNQQQKWFGEILALPHPRFILQYRRKQKDEYIQMYLESLNLAEENLKK